MVCLTLTVCLACGNILDIYIYIYIYIIIYYIIIHVYIIIYIYIYFFFFFLVEIFVDTKCLIFYNASARLTEV